MTLILSPCLYFVSTNDFAHDLPNFVEYTGKGLQLESLHNYLTNLKMQCKDLWIIVPENLGIALRLYENIFCWERKNWCLFSEQIVGWKREWRLRELRAPEKTWLRSNSSSFKMPAPKGSIILSFSCIHLTYFVTRGMTTIKHASTPLPKETEISSASLQQHHYVFWDFVIRATFCSGNWHESFVKGEEIGVYLCSVWWPKERKDININELFV